MKNSVTVEEYRNMTKKPPKYRNKPTTIKVGDNEIRFSSKKEAARYAQLIIMLGNGDIVDLKLQPQFTLQESYITPHGERVRAIKYTADFSYIVNGGNVYSGQNLVVEDVKSPATKTEKSYVLKKKLLLEKYGISIREG